MKVVGFGWIKSGDTLQKALDEYGITAKIEDTSSAKHLAHDLGEVKKDVKQSYTKKEIRKSAKPRYFRLVLEEIDI